MVFYQLVCPAISYISPQGHFLNFPSLTTGEGRGEPPFPICYLRQRAAQPFASTHKQRGPPAATRSTSRGGPAGLKRLIPDVSAD